MSSTRIQDSLTPGQTGSDMHALMSRLFPIARSITGEGVRESLRILQEYIPIEVYEVPSGTQVFDWNVPKEWNIRDAWIKDPAGNKVVDYQAHNLHVLGYSPPVQGTYTLEELKPHLFSLPGQPDLIPYRTSYYQENWGFCLAHNVLESLQPGTYEVMIDSTLEPGSLTYGEYYLPGEQEEEVLISAHTCHPSLCNDNLSGISVAIFLAQLLKALPTRKYSYRFVFAPATIGAITWLAEHKEEAFRIKYGLVASLLGGPDKFYFKKSRQGDTELDRIVAHVLKHSGAEYELLEFGPYGYDERQYCSPGFNLPVGNFTKALYGRFPEYHTSADNLEFVQPDHVEVALRLYAGVVDVIEANEYYVNQKPYGEVQLGKRGLYDSIGGNSDRKSYQIAMLWVLNLSDGKHSLLDIADRAGIPFSMAREIADTLIEHDLLRPVSAPQLVQPPA